VPDGVGERPALNASRKSPRGSPNCWGVISNAPGTASSRYVMGLLAGIGRGSRILEWLRIPK